MSKRKIHFQLSFLHQYLWKYEFSSIFISYDYKYWKLRNTRIFRIKLPFTLLCTSLSSVRSLDLSVTCWMSKYSCGLFSLFVNYVYRDTYPPSAVKSSKKPEYSDYSSRGELTFLQLASQFASLTVKARRARFPSETSRPPQSCLTAADPRQWRLCAFPVFLLGFTSQDFLFPATWMTLPCRGLPCSPSGSRNARGKKERK